MKRLSSLLLGSIVLAISGTVAADVSVDMVVQANAFDAKSGLLTGTLSGVPVEFLRTGTTTHQITDPLQLPPGPCRGISRIWNRAVKENAPQFVFDILMADMSLAKCEVRVSVSAAPASGDAPPMISVKPGH